MFDHTSRTQIDIAAPPARVWEVLTAFDQWPEWNAAFPRFELRGALRRGSRARLTFKIGPPRRHRSVDVRLVAVRDGQELTWRLGVTLVLNVRQSFVLEATPEGTRVVNTEISSGLLVPPILRFTGYSPDEGCERFNESLRQRCEHG